MTGRRCLSPKKVARPYSTAGGVRYNPGVLACVLEIVVKVVFSVVPLVCPWIKKVTSVKLGRMQAKIGHPLRVFP